MMKQNKDIVLVLNFWSGNAQKFSIEINGKHFLLSTVSAYEGFHRNLLPLDISGYLYLLR